MIFLPFLSNVFTFFASCYNYRSFVSGCLYLGYLLSSKRQNSGTLHDVTNHRKSLNHQEFGLCDKCIVHVPHAVLDKNQQQFLYSIIYLLNPNKCNKYLI